MYSLRRPFLSRSITIIRDGNRSISIRARRPPVQTSSLSVKTVDFFFRSLFHRSRYSALIGNNGYIHAIWLYNACINNNNSPRSRHSPSVRICYTAIPPRPRAPSPMNNVFVMISDFVRKKRKKTIALKFTEECFNVATLL